MADMEANTSQAGQGKVSDACLVCTAIGCMENLIATAVEAGVIRCTW